MFDIKRDGCGTVYHASEEHLGKHIKCNCGQFVAIRDERIHAESASTPAHPHVSWKGKYWYHRWQSWAVVGTAISVTLHSVPEGNARTKAISRANFRSGRRAHWKNSDNKRGGLPCDDANSVNTQD